MVTEDLTDVTLRELVDGMAEVVRSGRALSHQWNVPPDRPGGLTLTAAYFPVMRAMQTGEARVGDLATRLHSDVSVVSRSVSALESEGFVARRPDPHDGRVALVSLTAAGRAVLSQMDATRIATMGRALAGWSEHDGRQLVRLVHRLRDDVRATRDTS